MTSTVPLRGKNGRRIPSRAHGTEGGYSYYGCRCNTCVEAQWLRVRTHRESRKAERVVKDGVLVHPDAPHGTVTGYNGYSCRCQPCRTADSQRKHAWRHQRHGN